MDAYTCYGNQHDVEGRNFGKLAVIAPMLERIKLKEIINQHIPEWAEVSGADIFWNMPIEKMNDDRLGRSLDAFFEQRHSILGAVALHVAEEFKVPLSQLHYDPTHILFEGAYDNAVQRDGVVSAEGIRSNAIF